MKRLALVRGPCQLTAQTQVASLISFDESVVVYQSDSEFLEDEPLILDPPIDGTVYASVAKVHTLPRPARVLHPLTTTSARKGHLSAHRRAGRFPNEQCHDDQRNACPPACVRKGELICGAQVSDIVERFGANILTEFAEQFEESPLLWQVLSAILTAVLFSLIVLHVILGYREQKRIADNLAKLQYDEAPCPGRDRPPGDDPKAPCRKRK